MAQQDQRQGGQQGQGQLPPNVEVISPSKQLEVLQMFNALQAQEGVGKLVRLAEPRKIRNLPNPWPWSWDPDMVSLLLASWDSPAVLIIPLFRELAFTETPDGKALMYERSCVLPVRKAIEDSKILLAEPTGNVPKWPAGNCSYDMRGTAPGHKPTGITINSWHFLPGVIKDISPGFRDQIAEIHGRDTAEKNRLSQGFEHTNQPLAPIQ